MTRPVGRPRAFDQDAVLGAALELFWNHGFRATTTRDLEARLGLSQSSLYNAFGSKHDLLMAALNRYEHQITSELIGPLEASSDGLASIDRFFAALGGWVAADGRHGCLLVNMMAEDGGASRAIARRTTGYRKRLRDAFRLALKRAAEAGETSEEAGDVRPDLLLGLVLGLNVAARGGADPTELERMIAAARRQVAGWRVAGERKAR